MSCQSFSRNIGPAIIAWFFLLSLTSLYLVFICWDFSRQFSYGLFAAHSVLIFYVISTFGRATLMDPGYLPVGVPGEKMTTIEKGSARTVTYRSVEINGIATRLKWCVTCEIYRPPRCSHCSICKHCIDTFDHHCPWLNNCIGKRNYRYFFSFLIALTVHMMAVIGITLTFVLMRTDDFSNYQVIIGIFVLVMVGLLLLPVLGLTGFHIFLVSKGRTTNEQVTAKYDLDMNPYHEGCCTNWLYVFCKAESAVLLRPSTNLNALLRRNFNNHGERSGIYAVRSSQSETEAKQTSHLLSSSMTNSVLKTTQPSLKVSGNATQPPTSVNAINNSVVAAQSEFVGTHLNRGSDIVRGSAPPSGSVHTHENTTTMPTRDMTRGNVPGSVEAAYEQDKSVLSHSSTAALTHRTGSLPMTVEAMPYNQLTSPVALNPGMCMASDPMSAGYFSMAGDQSTPLLISPDCLHQVPDSTNLMASGRKFPKGSNSILYTSYDPQGVLVKGHGQEAHPLVAQGPPLPPVHGARSAMSRDSNRQSNVSRDGYHHPMVTGKPSSNRPSSSSLVNLRESPRVSVSHASVKTPGLALSTSASHKSPHSMPPDSHVSAKQWLQPPSPRSRSQSAGTTSLTDVADKPNTTAVHPSAVVSNNTKHQFTMATQDDPYRVPPHWTPSQLRTTTSFHPTTDPKISTRPALSALHSSHHAPPHVLHQRVPAVPPHAFPSTSHVTNPRMSVEPAQQRNSGRANTRSRVPYPIGQEYSSVNYTNIPYTVGAPQPPPPPPPHHRFTRGSKHSDTGQQQHPAPINSVVLSSSSDANANYWPSEQEVTSPDAETCCSFFSMASSLYDDLDVLDGTPLPDTGADTSSAPLVGLRVTANWSSSDVDIPDVYATNTNANTSMKLMQSHMAAKRAQGRRDGPVGQWNSKPSIAPVVNLNQRTSADGSYRFNQSTGRLERVTNSSTPGRILGASSAINSGGLMFGEPNLSLGVADEYNPLMPNEYEDLARMKRERRRLEESIISTHRTEMNANDSSGMCKRPDLSDDEEDDDDEDDDDMPTAASGKHRRPPTAQSASKGAAIAPPSILLEEPPIEATKSTDVVGDVVGSKFGINAVAAKMMVRMGYREGQGLGREGQGMSTALVVEKTSRRGGKIIHEKDQQRANNNNSTATPLVPDPIMEETITNLPLPENRSCVILLRNMCGSGEVDDDLEPETAEECTKYGKVVTCMIFELPDATEDEAVRIFVEFESEEGATGAVLDLNGRFFAGRIVKAGFYDAEKFRNLELADQPISA